MKRKEYFKLFAAVVVLWFIILSVLYLGVRKRMFVDKKIVEGEQHESHSN